MCEEIVDAAVNVPRAIIASLLINGILGLGMLVAILFRMGDPDAALAAQQTIGYPFIEIFIQATGSKAGSSVMTAILIVLAISASVGIVATASRMIWSFARDSGLPFSNVFSRVRCPSSRKH